MTAKWSERKIAAYLARFTFTHKHLVIVPNCSWPGSECDLLVVTPNLRVIDVEIKISRADLKADAAKDKWFHNWDWRIDGPWDGGRSKRRRREWPRKVWKHYYCLPAEIWKSDLVGCVAPTSGILLIRDNPYPGNHTPPSPLNIVCERPAKPCRDAQRIDPEDAVNIARLASLRMWDAYDTCDRLAAENQQRRAA